MDNDIVNVSREYAEFLRSLKERIRSAQVKAALSVNREMVLLYWQIGREILERQASAGWGAKVIERLSGDLRSEFPEMKGFSLRNLIFMRGFAEAFSDDLFVKQLVSQIPWGHIIRIIQMIKNPTEREWYMRKTIEHGWSRPVLVHQIEGGLYRRQGKAVTNFDRTLPPTQSDLANQVLKDPYIFDFLSLGEEAEERDLEQGYLSGSQLSTLEKGRPRGDQLGNKQKLHPTGGELEDSAISYPVGSQSPKGFHPNLSWSHYRALMRVEKRDARDFYENEAASSGWNKRPLERQITTLFYERLLMSKDKKGMLLEARREKDSLMPLDVLKDPYILEFLDLPDAAQLRETDLESAIISSLQQFLLELGKGFSFVARQKRMRFNDEDFYVDMVFYNYLLKCFVLIDLKIGKLTHQDIGQMDGYVRMYEEHGTAKDDNPTIGLILCSEKNAAVAKYSVLNESKQLFASKYLTYLPTEKELKRELQRERQLIEMNSSTG